MRKALFAVALLFVAAVCAQELSRVRVYNNVERGRGVVVTTVEGDTVCYTDRGTVDDAMRSDVFRELVQCMEKRALDVAERQKRSAASRLLRASGVYTTPSPRHRSVGPLLCNLWSQYEAPYDWLSPQVDGHPCDAGCVALAMAQVMHYWQWPEHGYGSYTYTDENGCGQTLSVDYSQHYYDWPNMLPEYENVQYTEAQGYAVAQLLYDSGVAVDMTYGIDGSGARVIKQPIAMVRNFGYDSSCQMHYRDFYTLDEWTQMFYDELDAGRPILMSGLSNKYNHAFVCDGYDERGFFHFSFGNVNGAADGFFYLPYLTPDIPPEMLPEEAEGGFNILQSMTTRLMPVSNPDATGVETHLFAMSGMDALGSDTCVVRNIGNIGWNMHRDSVALALVHNDEIVALPYVYEREFQLEEIDDTTYTDTIVFKLLGNGELKAENISAAQGKSAPGIQLAALPSGTSKLMPMYRDNGEWTAVRTSVGTPNYIIANVCERGIELRADTASSAYLTLDSFTFPDWLSTTRHAPDYTLQLSCHNADLCGRVYVLLENVVDTLPSVLLQRQGLTLTAGETISLRYYHTRHKIPQGTYNLRILYDHDLFTAYVEMFDNVQHTVTVSPTRPDAIHTPAADSHSPARNTPAYNTLGVQMPEDAVPHNQVYIKNGRKWLRK